MGNGKLWHPTNRNPLTDRHQIWYTRLCPGAYNQTKFGCNPLRGFLPIYVNISNEKPSVGFFNDQFSGFIVQHASERIFWKLVNIWSSYDKNYCPVEIEILWPVDGSLLHRDASRCVAFSFVFQWRSNALYCTQVPPSCESMLILQYGNNEVQYIMCGTLLSSYNNCHTHEAGIL